MLRIHYANIMSEMLKIDPDASFDVRGTKFSWWSEYGYGVIYINRSDFTLDLKIAEDHVKLLKRRKINSDNLDKENNKQ